MDFTQKIKKVLREIGLTDIQADFYIFVLKSGGASVSKIAKSLSINRTNSYSILEKLKEFELIREENRPQGKIIFAKSYKTILNALNNKEQEIRKYKSSVNDLVPIFNTFISSKNTQGPKVRIFEGKKELNNLVDDILDNKFKKKEILLFTNQETETGIFSKRRHDEFIRKRIAKKIKIRVLAVNNEKGQDLKSNDKNNRRETRLLPDNFLFNSEIYIYENKISMLDLKNDIVGVIIESEELYNIHTQVFEVLWQYTAKTQPMI